MLALEIGGRHLGFRRSDEDADSCKKYVSVEWLAPQAQRTQWYNKGGPSFSASCANDPWSGGDASDTFPRAIYRGQKGWGQGGSSSSNGGGRSKKCA